MKTVKSKKLCIPLLVFGTVFAVAAIAIFVMSLLGIRVFDTDSAETFIWDLLFLVSALVLSSLIILVSIFLKP